MLCIVYYKMNVCVYHTYNVMFTCTLLRSHPESKKTLGETWATAIKAIKSILWTSVASRCSLTRMGAGPGSVCGQKGTMKDVFARCLKRADVQVCTLTIVYILFCNCDIHALATYVPLLLRSTITVLLHLQIICDCIITGVYFRRLKIKPWSPWVYTWSWHSCEQ
jgi:hypothetical protein